MKRRFGRIIPAVLLLGLAILPASSKAATYPSIAGTTVIHAQGSSGITLRVPAATRVGQSISLSLDHASYADVLFERQDGAVPGECGFCFTSEIFDVADDGWPPIVGTCTDDPGNNVGCPIHAGLLNLYIVSDGAITVTIGFPDLDGATTLNATGRVHSILERIPLTCPTGDCDKVAYGGIAHEIGLTAPALVGAYGYFRVPNYIPGSTGVPNYTVNTFDVCTYPGYFHHNVSPNPQDHPLGCDPVVNPVGNGAVIFVCPLCTGAGSEDGNLDAHGLVYTGIRLEKAEAVSGGPPEGWGEWLDQGINCPSGDFAAC